ncbi:hypothetical protein YPPY11_1853, partial [Yersinia pestis PY-11]
MLIDMLILK